MDDEIVSAGGSVLLWHVQFRRGEGAVRFAVLAATAREAIVTAYRTLLGPERALYRPEDGTARHMRAGCFRVSQQAGGIIPGGRPEARASSMRSTAEARIRASGAAGVSDAEASRTA
jgi:hypothetical protein